MRFSKSQIAAAIAALLALVAGVVLLAFNNSSNPPAAQPAPPVVDEQPGGTENPFLALPHAIAACEAFGSVRHQLANGSTVDEVTDSLASAVEEGNSAVSYDPAWQRLTDTLQEFNDPTVLANINSVDSLTARAGSQFSADRNTSTDPSVVVESICESLIDQEITSTMAGHFTCAYLHDWNTATTNGVDRFEREVLLLQASSYAYALFWPTFSEGEPVAVMNEELYDAVEGLVAANIDTDRAVDDGSTDRSDLPAFMPEDQAIDVAFANCAARL